jgi:hypothetical protein
MASFDFGSVSAYRFALGATNVTANTNTAAIDTRGFEGVAVVAVVSTSNLLSTGPTITMAFREGNDTNISNATALPAKYIVSNQTLSGNNATYKASVVPSKRYLFAQLITSAACTANLSVIGALGYPQSSPTT